MELGEALRCRRRSSGVQEVGFTVLSMSLSLIAVFFPILLMGGIVGLYFREFAVTLSVAILISMVVSLTTTPMMCARLLSVHRPTPPSAGGFYRWSEETFETALGAYRRTLATALRHRFLTIIVLVVTVGLNIWLFAIIPKGFFPEQDTGRMFGFIQADQSISFQKMSEKLRQYVAIIQKDPDVDNVVGFTGAGGGGGNGGRMFIQLRDLGPRKASTEQIMARLRPQLAHVPGSSLFMMPAQEVRVGGRMSYALYQYTLQSDSLADLRTWTPKLLEALKDEPILSDLNSDQQDHGLETDLVIDRDTASRMNLTAIQIDNTLYDAFGQRTVSTIYKSLNQYHVVMVVQPRFWQEPEALKQIFVSSTGGTVTGTQSTNAVAGTVTAARAIGNKHGDDHERQFGGGRHGPQRQHQCDRDDGARRRFHGPGREHGLREDGAPLRLCPV
jgi:multidrug efflux pump